LPALMDRADRALYVSKRSGKGVATLAEAASATDMSSGSAAVPGHPRVQR
jgi:predicted signal transduction protein with EAL and GGDEF domain